MKKIVFVSHCILNTASKVILYNQEEMDAEESLRKEFLQKAIADDISSSFPARSSPSTAPSAGGM